LGLPEASALGREPLLVGRLAGAALFSTQIGNQLAELSVLDEEGVDALMSGLRDRLVGNEPADSLPEYVPKGAAIVEAAQVLRPAPSPPPPPPPPPPTPITAAATATAALAAGGAGAATAAATFAPALTAALTAATPGRALGASR